VHPLLSGQEQNLYIKREALDGLAREQELSGARRKTLETALRIFNSRQKHALNKSVKDPPHEVTMTRFTNTDCPWSLASSDGNITGSYIRWQKPVNLSRGHGEVRITQEAELARGGQHSSSHSATFAPMGLFNQAQASL
jgi:hypothetical protein